MKPWNLFCRGQGRTFGIWRFSLLFFNMFTIYISHISQWSRHSLSKLHVVFSLPHASFARTKKLTPKNIIKNIWHVFGCFACLNSIGSFLQQPTHGYNLTRREVVHGCLQTAQRNAKKTFVRFAAFSGSLKHFGGQTCVLICFPFQCVAHKTGHCVAS